MDYAAQIAMKRDVLIESLHGVPGMPDLVEPILGCESPFYFRNKMGFSFGVPTAETVLGLHRRGDWRTVVDAQPCMLQSKEAGEILRRTLELVKQKNVAVFDDKNEHGRSASSHGPRGQAHEERMV